ncbi:MAG: hypothetical protein ACYC0X_12080 [Pirellulaceae bacterium]
MQRFLRSIVTAIVTGLVFFFGSIYILMTIGLKRHGNYEYYGSYWALYTVPGIVGFVLPSVVAWILRRRRQGN